jgi:predicted acyl esterase
LGHLVNPAHRLLRRITDVHPDGRSLAIAQTLRRLDIDELTELGTPLHITLNLGPVAHRLAQGHRLRLQIASGAHPFYARNLGTGEPLATGTAMITARQSVHHGTAAHASGITVRVDPREL